MNLTNKSGLPEALLSAVRNDSYSRGNSDISVTQLIDSPMIRRLRAKHKDEIEEDVADRIWALLGQSVHTILERANLGGLVETRVFWTFDEIKLSGQFDHLENGILTDWKMTSVWSVIYGKTSWGSQLNVLDYLCGLNSHKVEKLQVVAVLRDWQKSKANEEGYPNNQVVVVPVKRWSTQEQEKYIVDRLRLHFYSEPTCSDLERWVKSGKFAVMKKGKKSALRLLDSEKEAETWCMDNAFAGVDITTGLLAMPMGITIVERPTSFGRCENYCNVSKFCPVWNKQ